MLYALKELVMSNPLKQPKRRRPSLNFREMGVPLGSMLKSIESGETATVVTERTVKFRGQIISLTEATKLAMGISHNMAPTHHWNYDGKFLGDIYEETYGPPE